jgi:general secretion pathway protein D
MVKQQFYWRQKSRILVLATIVLLCSSYFTAAGQDDYDLAPYEFINLKNITPEQGKKFLDDLGIGTVSHIPGSSALLVTAQPRELAKAKTVINLIDEVEQFSIQNIFPATEAGKLPPKEQIAAKVGNITIGGFTTVPAEQTGTRAIIDFHNDALVVIAPTSVIDKIVTTVRQLQRTEQANKQEPDYIANKAIIEQNTVAALLGQKVTDQQPPQIQVTEQTVAEQNALKQKLLERMAGSQNITQQTTSQQTEPQTAANVQSSDSVFIPNADDVIKLTLPEKQSMTDFLGMVGPYLQLDLLYNESDFANQDVTFSPNGKLQGPITIRDLYHLLESVLKFKGFVMTRGLGNLVTIVPKDNALDIDPALVKAEKPQIGTGDVVVMSIFELEHISTESAKEFLEGMKLTTEITSIAETKTLIVTAYAYRMPRIKTLLDIVDRPGEPRKFRFRQLRYTMAQTLAPKLQTLAEELGTVSITIAATEETTTPQRPTKLPNESQTAYNARVRAWSQRIQRERAAARNRSRGTTTAAQQAESVTPTVYLDADERTNRILMIGLVEQLDDVEELIDTLDVAQQDLRTLKPYKIEYLDAEEVRKKLEEFGVIGTRSESTMSSRRTGDTKAPPTTAQTPASRAQTQRLTAMGLEETTTETLAGEPQVVVIETTNSLLVNATDEQHERIASIINHVDQQRPEGEIPYKIYPLENSSPAHLRDLLMQLIEETVESQQAEDDKIEITKRRRLEEQITIVDDPNTFSLIVYANKKNQDWISNLIKTLDKRRPQVLIDVTLVEVSRVDLFDLDLDLVSKFPRMAAGAEMDKLDALLEPFVSGRVIETTSFSGEGQGFYSDRHIQALLKAMQTKSYGRVLAKPKILVNDGQPGTISTTDKTNVKIESAIVPEEGNAQTQTDFREYSAGIELVITPNISEGDLLLLKVQMSRSDFGETPVEGAPPNTTESVVDTTVTVPDGQTIILGGLIKLNQTKGGSKVPLLGDIPLVGGLFRNTSNTDRSSNLYVFVKANILRPDDTVAGLPDLERMSDRNRASFERLEDEFQRYEDWPGFKPKPMEPFKVLDAE